MTESLNRNAALVLTLAAALVLGSAFAFEHLGGLAPCELCWWQRYVYMVAIPLGLAAMALDRADPAYGGVAMMALAMVFATGAGIASFHVGVEQGWWKGPSACSALSLDGNFEDMFNSLLKAPVIRCDEVAWNLFGISMAGYNVIISLGLAGFAGWVGLNRLKTAHG